MRCSWCSAVAPRRAAAWDQADEADWLPCQHRRAGRRMYRLRSDRTHHGIHAVWKPAGLSPVRTRHHISISYLINLNITVIDFNYWKSISFFKERATSAILHQSHVSSGPKHNIKLIYSQNSMKTLMPVILGINKNTFCHISYCPNCQHNLGLDLPNLV